MCCVIDKENRIITKNEKVQVNLFFGEDPFAMGHIVVQPKNHVTDISELGKDDWKTLSEWIPKVTNAMKKVLRKVMGREVQKIYLCSFNESKRYPVHFHLIPRYECETQKGPDLLYSRTKAKLMISPHDEEKIVSEMRGELGSKT